jgi:hypothetical protein
MLIRIHGNYSKQTMFYIILSINSTINSIALGFKQLNNWTLEKIPFKNIKKMTLRSTKMMEMMRCLILN